jgi:hypothetical protein
MIQDSTAPATESTEALPCFQEIHGNTRNHSQRRDQEAVIRESESPDDVKTVMKDQGKECIPQFSIGIQGPQQRVDQQNDIEDGTGNAHDEHRRESDSDPVDDKNSYAQKGDHE